MQTSSDSRSTGGRRSGPIWSMLRQLRPYRARLVAALMFQLVKDSPLWAIPVITAAVIDTVVSGGDPARLWGLIVLALLVLAQNYPNHLIYVRIYSQVYRGVAANLRNQLADHLQQLTIGSHSRRGSAVMQTKIVRDVENVELLLQAISPVLAVSTSILVGSIAVTAVQVPAFLLVYLLTVPLGVALVARMRRRAGIRNEQFRREVEGLATNVNEMASLMNVIRAHSLEATASGRIAESAESVRQAGLSLDRLNSRFETTSWVTFNVLSVMCLGLAGWASMTEIVPVTPGQVVLLSTYFATLTTGVTNLVNLTPMVAKGVESMKSIDELLADPDVEANEGKPLLSSELSGRVTFESVSFRYPGAQDDAITDLTLEIQPGETVALVGASGSGKSTVTNLLLGFVRPSAGRILIDGIDSQSIDMRSFRSRVSIVPQEPAMLRGSVRENVTYGLDEVPEVRVQAALAAANATEFVERLPHGIHTLIGGDGVSLSGGQRQRLAIARALVREPRILILDEATSALDSESERLVRQALSNLTRDRTCIIIAHRLTTIRDADRIAVLRLGSIVELGTHRELMRLGGEYAGLQRATNQTAD